MGYYINPKDCTKEQWLRKNATPISFYEAVNFVFNGTDLPVCLIDNGIFTAAGIAYSPVERDVFIKPDSNGQRPRSWFKVSKSLLEPWYKD